MSTAKIFQTMRKRADNWLLEGETGAMVSRELHTVLDILSAAESTPPDSLSAELAEALRDLHECSKCQNGCAPDDMSCATNKARAVLRKYDEAKRGG